MIVGALYAGCCWKVAGRVAASFLVLRYGGATSPGGGRRVGRLSAMLTKGGRLEFQLRGDEC
mgnify:CR=1 FL=1